MKSLFKLIRIAALIALTTLSTASCNILDNNDGLGVITWNATAVADYTGVGFALTPLDF